MTDPDYHHIKITKEAAAALHKEKTLQDRTYSKTILRILDELEDLRRYKRTVPDKIPESE